MTIETGPEIQHPAPQLSVVVPLFNEEDTILELYARIKETLTAAQITFELIFIDDGSRDRSLEIIRRLSGADPRIRFSSFSRNFGHEAATTAGFRMVRGQAAVLIDADLQDPPELIPRMYELLKQGHDMVYGRRKSRAGEGLLKKISSHLFYRVINAFSAVKIPLDVGDFRLLDRKVVDAFNALTERNRFVRGLFAWIGYRQVAVDYDRQRRKGGATKYNWLKLILLSMDALFGFSLVPLRLCSLFGLVTILFSFVMVSVIVIQRLFLGLDIPGYALMTTGMFFLGGIQLTFLGVIGEYLGKVFSEVQGRPLYLIRETSDSSGARAGMGEERP